jgi:poly(beta-D-mannuronate) lyase
MLLIEPPKNGCAPASITEPNPNISDDQRTNANAIIEAGRKLKVPDFGIAIALAVALQESNLTNINYGDAAGPDSRGLFQQRTSWGTEAERMDPAESATLFYKALQSVPGWESMPLTDAAAKVQNPRADLRGEYAKHEGTARMLLAEAGGDTQLVSQSTGGTPKIDPNTWKLTLPTGDAEEKRGNDLASFVHPVLYHPGRGGGWVFNAPAGGDSTGGSDYPRTELRELDGGKEAAWTNKNGTHEMVLQQSITSDAGGAGVVAGQIHDDEDDVLRVVLKGSRLYASFSAGKGNDLPYQTIDDNYRLGTPFNLRILADPTGIHVFYNGQEKASLDKQFTGGYFKAGAYTQSTDKGDGAGEVVIYSLAVTHDGKGSSSQFGQPIPGQQTCTCTLPPGSSGNPSGPATVELSDKRIDQSSGLAMSRKHPGIVYTINDDPGPVFAIDTATGKVVGTTEVGRTDDTEALAADSRGRLWLANLGNNHGNTAGLSLVVFDEPGRASGNAANVHRYGVDYPGAAPNVEALIVSAAGEISLFTKENGHGRRYTLPADLSETGSNTAQPAAGDFPALVSDATLDGTRAYLRHGDGVAIYDTSSWTQVGSLDVPKVDKGETITVDGDAVLVGSEGTNSPLIRVPLAASRTDGEATQTSLTATPAECAADDLQLVSTNIGNGPVLHGLDANNFGRTGPRWKNGHTGNDYGAPCGSPVLAVHDGTVHIQTGDSWYGKWLVSVNTGPDSLSTNYAHMQSVDVEDGQPVKAGAKLGTVGDLGNSEGCHLHLEVHTKGGDGGTNDDAIDPHAWLSTNGGQLIQTMTEDDLDDQRD